MSIWIIFVVVIVVLLYLSLLFIDSVGIRRFLKTPRTERKALLKAEAGEFVGLLAKTIKTIVIVVFALIALGWVLDVARTHKSHDEDVTVLGIHNWMTGEIKECQLTDGILQCGNQDSFETGHVFSVEFNRRVEQEMKTSSWKCKRGSDSFSCELDRPK